MIAEVVPPVGEIATKTDVLRLEAAIAALGKEFGDRMLKYFVPLWIAVFGALGSMIALLIVSVMGM